MNRSPRPKTGTAVFLYTIGLALVTIAVLVILNGMGILSSIPSYVYWALILLVIGCGLLGGINSIRK